MGKNMDDLNVSAELLAIPVSAANKNNNLHLDIAVQISPTAKEDGTIELAEWPAKIALLSQSMFVTFTPTSGAEPTTFKVNSGLADLTGDGSSDNAERRQQMVSTWRKVFKTENDLKNLINALENNGNGTDDVTTRSFGQQNFRTAAFADFFERLDKQLLKANERFSTKEAKSSAKGDKPERAATKNLCRVAEAALNKVEKIKASSERFEYFRNAKVRGEEGALVPDKELISLFETNDFDNDDLRISNQAVINKYEVLYQNFVDFLACFETPYIAPEAMQTALMAVDNEQLDTAARRLTGIMSHPSLAYWLGCGVPLQIRLSLADLQLKPNTNYVLEVNFEDGTGYSAKTMVKLVLDDSSGWGFEIVPRDTQAFTNGHCLDFSCEIATDVKRFKFSNYSPTTTCMNILDMANRVAAGYDDDADIIQSQKRGMVLYDMGDDTGQDNPEVHYLEDLVVGLRPDFSIHEYATPDRQNEYYSIMQRRIDWQSESELFSEFIGSAVMQNVGTMQDDGFSPWPVPSAYPVVESGGQLFIRQEQKCSDILMWNGEPGGVEFQKDPAEEEEGKDLGLSRTYFLPEPTNESGDKIKDNLLPRLRAGQSYNLGCRFVFPLGVSIGREAAQILYKHGLNYTEGTGSDPVKFEGHIAGAPDVHLLWRNDPLVDEKEPAKTHPEEAINYVVVGPERRRYRIVTPPRIGFTDAELEGQFDDLEDVDFPRGAFHSKSDFPAWMFTDDVMLPEARQFKRRSPEFWYNKATSELTHFHSVSLTDISSSKVSSKDMAAKSGSQSRGSVFILGKPKRTSRRLDFTEGYFPSQEGSSIDCTLKINISTNEGSTVQTAIGECQRFFWQTSKPSDAAPILLAVEKGSQSKIAKKDSDRIYCVDDRYRTLPLINVELEEGDEGIIELRPGSNSLNSKLQTINVVHPLRRPRYTPSFKADDGSATLHIAFNSKDPAQIGDDDNKEDIATVGGSILKMDRRVVGKIRCDAEWDEYGRGTYAELPDGTWIENLSRRQETLIDIEPKFDRKADTLSLSPKKDQFEGSLDVKFNDQRARQLRLQLVATSRFSRFYPDGAVNKDPDEPNSVRKLGPFDKASEPFSKESSIWLKCAFRPPEPTIRKIHPVLVWEKNKINNYDYTMERKSKLRIHLDKDWFATGQGEKLGIVLLDEKKFPNVKKVNDFETVQALNPFKDYITRPARLAYLKGHVPDLYLTAEHFDKQDDDLVSVELSLLPNDKGEIRKLDVKIFPLDVNFDKQQGLFADIRIKADNVSAVHFGLVRYQEHAEQANVVSPPVAHTTALLPDFSIEVKRSAKFERKITVQRTNKREESPKYLTYFTGIKYDWDNRKKRWHGGETMMPKSETPGEAKFSFEVEKLRAGSWVMIEEFEVMDQDPSCEEGVRATSIGKNKRCVFHAMLELP